MKLFAVVGMHRSGTSIVSRILNLLGAHLGPEDDLMLPKPDNPKGFWETLTVARIHDDLFAELDGRWDRPPLLEPGWEMSPQLEPYVERIRAVVGSHFADSEVAAWKDPRGSMFLPLWRRVVPIEKVVLCIRRPEEVAGSLAAREGMGSEHAAALWLRYVAAAWLDEAEHVTVTFDESYDRPRELVRRLAALIGVPVPTEAVLSEIRGFIEPTLRHSHPMTAEPGPAMRLASATYALITTEPPDVIAPILGALSTYWRVDSKKDDPTVDLRAFFERVGPSVYDLSRGKALISAGSQGAKKPSE